MSLMFCLNKQLHRHFFLYFDINQTQSLLTNSNQTTITSRKQETKQIKSYEKTCRFTVTEFLKTYDDLVTKDHQIDGESFDDFLHYETLFYMKKALEFRHLSR